MDSKKKTMNKTDIVQRVAHRSGLTNVETTRVVNSFLKEVGLAVAEGNRVVFARFGIFEARHFAARMAQNPRTGEAVPVEARTGPNFRAADAFKTLVNETAKTHDTSAPSD